jgi:hypothetical protein
MKKMPKKASPIEKLQESAKNPVRQVHGGTQMQPVIQTQRRHQSR